MNMNWGHAVIGIVLLIVGYYLGSKHPGMLTKFTGGTVQA